MKNTFNWHIFVLFILLTVGIPQSIVSFSQSPNSIFGTIIDDKDLEGLPFVSVTLFHNDTLYQKEITDFNGEFSFFNTPEGNFEVLIEANYYNALKIVNIKREKQLFIDFQEIKLTKNNTETRPFQIITINVPLINQTPGSNGKTFSRSELNNSLYRR